MINIEKAKTQFPQDTYGYSQFYQTGVLVQIFDIIKTTNKFFVEFGARRPGILNSSYFRIHQNWKGVLLDGSPGKSRLGGSMKYRDVKKLLFNKDDSSCILREEFITADNIIDIFLKYKIPNKFDLLTIDIDLNDYYVARRILENGLFKPRVFCIEFCSYFNSKELFVPVYKPDGYWEGKSITGSSLLAIHNLFTYYNYSYITHVEGEHAIYVLNTELEEKYRYSEIPYIIDKGWQYNRRKKEQINLNLWDIPYDLSFKYLTYINIGTSEKNEKKIILKKPLPKNTKIYLTKSTYVDTFEFKIDNDILIIKRLDNNSGWSYEHSIICYL